VPRASTSTTPTLRRSAVDFLVSSTPEVAPIGCRRHRTRPAPDVE
jgi:hypothetical protein